MNVIGKMVNHKTFGVGTVTELTDTIITISFRGTEKDSYIPMLLSVFWYSKVSAFRNM